MIAPQAAMGIEPGPGHDTLRANQLIEAGLWLHLGGDGEGARSLFLRALAHDPSNSRARELLAKGTSARPTAPVMSPSPPAVRPISLVPPPVEGLDEPVVAQPAVEVSVVLLDEGTEVDSAAPVPQVDPLSEVATLLQGVEELLSLGDPASALELVRKAEEVAPGDARLAAARERCAREQQALLEAKLGSLKRVPVLKLRMQELMRLSLDPRAGFLLSRIDGMLSYEALFSVSGMSRLDTLRVLGQLVDQDIITVR